jgi:hypothetical protein
VILAKLSLTLVLAETGFGNSITIEPATNPIPYQEIDNGKKDVRTNDDQ